MFTALAAQNWAMFVLRGVLALALGVLAFAAPGPTLAALIFVFAAYAIFDGVLATALGLADPAGPRWLLIVGGIIGVAIGAYALVNPQVTAVALVLLIGLFAIVRGVAEVGSAIWFRNFIQSAWLYVLSWRRVDRFRRVSDRRPRRRRPGRPLRDRLLRPLRRCHVHRDGAAAPRRRQDDPRHLQDSQHRLLTGTESALATDTSGIEPIQEGDRQWTSTRS